MAARTAEITHHDRWTGWQDGKQGEPWKPALLATSGDDCVNGPIWQSGNLPGSWGSLIAQELRQAIHLDDLARSLGQLLTYSATSRPAKTNT